MGQILGPDNIPSIVVASTTSLTLASTNQGLPTYITVGGQQYAVPSILTLSTGTVGANGLDAGSLGNIQLWYVYAIVNQSTFTVALIASQASPSAGPTMPSGYGTSYKLVGAFYTNGSSQVGSTVTISGTATTGWMSFPMVVTASTTNPTKGTAAADAASFRRNGDVLEVEYNYRQSSTGSAGSGDYRYTIPGSLAINYSANSGNNVNNPGGVGVAFFGQPGVATSSGVVLLLSATTNQVLVSDNASTSNALGSSSSSTFTYANANFGIGMRFSVPIVGWNATLL